MSVEPLPESPVADPFMVPEWLRHAGGFTAPDLDRLPGLPPHTELIDGNLIFVSPQKRFHMRALRRLEAGLVASVPPALEVEREMSIVLNDRQRPEPDLSVIDAHAIRDDEHTWYPAEVVRLVVEVVSPESVERDRERKPELYARAGIPHFWRVEQKQDKPVVYVYELDPATGSYSLTGIHHDRLKLPVPYELDIDLTL